MNARLASILLLVFSVVGCSQDALLQRFASAEDQATARKYVDYLRAGQFAAIEATADPGINSPGLRGMLEQMERLIPDEEPISTKLVGAQTMHGLNVATYQKGEDPLTIVGLHVYPQAQSLEEQNRFSLAGKTPNQYLILVLAILLAHEQR